MVLPAAVQAKVDRANLLLKSKGQPTEPQPATPKPALVVVADDVETLKRQLAEANSKVASETQRANSADGVAKKAAAEAKAAKEAKEAAEKKLKDQDEARRKALESGEVEGLTEAERNLVGKDLLGVVIKTSRLVAKAEFAEALKPWTERVDLLDRLTEEGYLIILDQIPNFSTQNDDPKFMAWLHQNDPTTNQPRLHIIRRAEEARQPFLVSEIFAAFREGREIGMPKPGVATTGPAAIVDAGSGGGAEVVVDKTAEGKKIWTRLEIRNFYDEKRRGLWRGKEAEARKLEIDISAASVEGRIRDR